MGWVVVIAAVPMLEIFLASTTINGVEALLWLLAGGIFLYNRWSYLWT